MFFRHKIWHTTDGTESRNQYYKIHKRFRNYPSSSFTRLHNLTLCHFHKYRDLSNGVVTCHASPCLALPRPLLHPRFFCSTPSIFDRLWNRFVDQIREGGDRLWTQFIDQILPSVLGGESCLPRQKPPPPPPLQHVMCKSFFTLVLFKNWEI